MAPTLYFGIELEFCLGYFEAGTPDPDPASRKARCFPGDDSVIDSIIWAEFDTHGSSPTMRELCTEYKKKEEAPEFGVPFIAIREHMSRTFIAAGLPCSLVVDDGPISIEKYNWTITEDSSVEVDDFLLEGGYEWLSMEITSPAYKLNEGNLAAVERACHILTTQYLTLTNQSTGLHVHFSSGIEKDSPRWQFDTLQKILQFFWAFHTQFDTIHPAHRQINGWARSMRVDAAMVNEFYDEGNFGFSVADGIEKLRKATDMAELFYLVSMPKNERYMAYNVDNIANLIADPKSLDSMQMKKRKPTIEFRQHEGTLDGKRATAWIRTLGGVICYVMDASEEDWYELIQYTSHEKWQKTGGEEDVANQTKFGPVAAESSFTIIHILETMGLHKQANFYRGQLHAIAGQRSSFLLDFLE